MKLSGGGAWRANVVLLVLAVVVSGFILVRAPEGSDDATQVGTDSPWSPAPATSAPVVIGGGTSSTGVAQVPATSAAPRSGGSVGSRPAPAPVASGASDAFDWNNALLILGTDGTFRALAHDGGELRTMFSVPSSYWAAWSPDRQWVTYTSDGGVWVARRDGSGRRLVSADAAASRWSPDGTRLVFECDGVQNGRSHICTAATDGSGRMDLTPGDEFAGQPDWSPDGASLVFVSQRGVEVMTVEGTGRTVVRINGANGDGGSESVGWPRWSPDGRRLAFGLKPAGYVYYDIWVMGADGSSAVALGETKAAEFSPAWAPDGSAVAFARTDETSREPAGTLVVSAPVPGGRSRVLDDRFDRWGGSVDW